MRNIVEILEVPIDSVTMKEAVEKVVSFCKEEGLHTVYTPNSEILMAAQRDLELKNILKNGDLLVADGAGVVLAARILKLNIPQKVSGIDLVKNLFEISEKEHLSYFFFGGKPGVAELATENIKKAYRNIEIRGCLNGYFTKEEEADIIEQINSSGAKILLVALGAPKQEKWIHASRDKLKVRVCIGVGGTLDVFAGKAKLAPEFIRKCGLEWLYRLCREPWRYKRMLDLPRFMLRILAIKLGFKK